MADMKKIKSELENGTLKVLGENDKFDFNCVQCGDCCIDRDDVIVTPYDIMRIAKYTDKTPIQILDDHCIVTLGGESKIPLALLKQNQFLRNGKVVSGCSFLKPLAVKKDSYICSIHKAKPFVCAVYPLGKITKTQADGTGDYEIEYFYQPVTCQGGLGGKLHTVKGWLGDFNLDEYNKASLDFNKFLMEIQRTASFYAITHNQTITPKTKDMIYNAYINIVYLGVGIEDNELPLLELLKKRYAKYIEVLTELKKGMDLIGIKLEDEIINDIRA